MKSRQKSLIKECDKLWSQAIKKRDGGICQRCFKPGKDPHHIFYRRYLSTRHLIENGIFLCFGCHRGVAHGMPEVFRDFIIRKISERQFSLLKIQAQSTQKVDLEMRKIELKAYLNVGSEIKIK